VIDFTRDQRTLTVVAFRFSGRFQSSADAGVFRYTELLFRSSKFTYEYINTIFLRFFGEVVGLLQRNKRGDIRARGLLTDMLLTENMEFTRKPILSLENEKGGIPWIPEHDVLKMVQWSTITSVRSIAIILLNQLRCVGSVTVLDLLLITTEK